MFCFFCFVFFCLHPPSLISLCCALYGWFLHADSEDRSDCADAQADLSLRWAYRWFCWFCHAAALIWTASSEFGTYRLCEQRRFRRACASAQSRQNLRCSLIQAVSQEEPSDRKPDPWPLWMAGHAQLKFVMTACLKTEIRLTGLIYSSQ